MKLIIFSDQQPSKPQHLLDKMQFIDTLNSTTSFETLAVQLQLQIDKQNSEIELKCFLLQEACFDDVLDASLKLNKACLNVSSLLSSLSLDNDLSLLSSLDSSLVSLNAVASNLKDSINWFAMESQILVSPFNLAHSQLKQSPQSCLETRRCYRLSKLSRS